MKPRRVQGLLDGVAELTLQTRDPDALERFYCQAFGCRVLSREDDRIWLEVGERTRLGLWTPGAKEFDDMGGRHVHFAFRVAPGALDRLREHLGNEGIKFDGPIEHDGGDRSLYVKDPEGNVVEVWDFFHRSEGKRKGVEALR